MNKYKGALAIALGAFALIAGTGLTVSSAWLITMASQHPPILVLSVCIVLVRFFGISRSASRYAERLYSHEAVFSQLTSLRENLYQRITSAKKTFVRTLQTEGLTKSIVDDLERAQEYLLRVTFPAHQAVGSVLIGCLIGWWIDVHLLLALVPASAILLVFIPAIVKKFSVASSREIESLESRYAKAIEGTLGAIWEAEIFGFAEKLKEELAALEMELLNRERAHARRNFLFQLLTQSTIATMLISSALIAHSHQMTQVGVAMSIFLPLVIFEGITLWYPNLYQSGKLLRALESIGEIESTYIQEPKLRTVTPNGVLRVRDMSASWGEDFARPISFSAKPGDLLVIRGESGVGKSTLALALAGLLPYRGSAQSADEEIQSIENIEDHISGSLQSGHIFNTTIRENLKIADAGASDNAIKRVLEIVDLENLDLDEVVGDYGRQLSGGEGKRLGVARALLSPAPIVILDEPTEHLDADLAERLEEKIAKASAEKTLIVITHSGWFHATQSLELARE